MATLFTPFLQVETSAGVPISGALLYFYAATTTTPITTYTDSGLGTQHQHPVVADATGMFPQIWIAASTYKFELKTAAGVTLLTVDNISGNSSFSDSLFTIQDGNDTTKQLNFQLSGITTATTRTWTVQDVSGTVYVSGGTDIPIADGGTGASTAAAAVTNLFPSGVYLPLNYISGFAFSNNSTDPTNDVDITAGKCRDSTDAQNIFGTAMTKRLDAGWVAGSAQGFRNSAAAITDTTYHVYAVSKALGADPDYYAHTSTTVATVITALQAETGGSAYVYARRIFSLVRASSTILAFRHLAGDDVIWDVIDASLNTTSVGTSSSLRTVKVPTGLQIEAIMDVGLLETTNDVFVLVTDPAQTDTAPTSSLFDFRHWSANPGPVNVEMVRRTNTSAQVRTRASQASVSSDFWIKTRGYRDPRRFGV
jgi:hypothetical protein